MCRGRSRRNPRHTQFVELVVLVAVISVENLRTLSVNLTADKEEFEARRFSIAVGVELVCIRSAAPIFIVVTEIKRIFFKATCTVSLQPETRND